MRQRLAVIGSSGHASVVIDAIEQGRVYDIVGYLDDTVPKDTIRRGYPVLGRIEEAGAVFAKNLINGTVIAIGDNWTRKGIYLNLKEEFPNLEFPAIKHPSAVIAASTEIGPGTVVLACAHIGPGSRAGEFCIINTGSSVDHDCRMRDFSSLAPGVSTGGFVNVGECSAVGVGASIPDRISIGNHSVIGTGAVVVRDVPDLAVAYGNPARVQRSRREGEAYLKS